ncbi:alpha/beta hydrolase [Ancylomarina euxinus]|uniref:Alpha/beta hydrolase n=1 Tax=Ancylomarina euxinus TaxID=2283627 RepID=A0A425Y2Y8_9BACT|nr:alpha/beta hydrolase [Ancylomarina euxinus]MCZ4693258.1 alpha/beta hydrolase [Ancylomarina euxinus]MUP16789.1 alpha/beta fold hydrolase [Ancylomarina euxinus]RRG22485.1 alpha/beta hydrolase [Ancylomarina euxinus]
MIKWIDTIKYKIRFSDQGDGAVIVILHGYLESIETFDAIACDLSKSARIICIDLPGHGESDLKQDHVSVEDMADAVYAVIQHLNTHPIHLIGHSMGGYVALAFADKYAHNLASFTFMHSSANADTEDKRANRAREIEFIRKGKKELICSTAIPNTFSTKNQEAFSDVIDALIDIASRTKDEGIIAALNAMMIRQDRNKILRELSVPKYSFIGKEDNFIPFEKGVDWAHNNGMKPFVFEHSGHMSFIEEKEKCIAAVQSILADL